MRLKTATLAVIGLVALGSASYLAMEWLWPRKTPTLVAVTPPPPLPPAPRSSRMFVPVAIPLSLIRDTIDQAAPRDFAGKGENPAPQILSRTDINWAATRGPISAASKDNAIVFSTPLNGTLKFSGELSASTQDAIGGVLNQFLGADTAKRIGGINIKSVNTNADIRGDVMMSAQPALAANWRIDPRLAASVNLGDTALSVSGIRVSVPRQVKPMIDRAVNDQLAQLQERLRNDPTIEQVARSNWQQMCRSIPLQGVGAGLPPLWLELKPTKAIAAQPAVDGKSLTLTLGIEAASRITPKETRPECPFPATLDLVSAKDAGRVSIGVPIDLPFTDINRILDAQLKDKTFPEDGSGAVAVKVKRATVAPSGDRLLLSLLIDASEKKSFLNLGGEATVQLWGRPVLDQKNQILRLADIELAVESEAAFGLLGTAARAAMPFLEQAITEKAVIDLKPLAADAKKQIAEVIAQFRKNADGAQINASVADLRLAGIAFDATTLRVIAEATGNASVTVTKLPKL
ncbi:MAG TPA: DUF4403 family protein [Xanthobacteraceae bacterium]|nr:DUF4403 family protein [Xanthobacteraceae bacterium]